MRTFAPLLVLGVAVVTGCGKKPPTSAVADVPPRKAPFTSKSATDPGYAVPTAKDAAVDPRNTNYQPGAGVVRNVAIQPKRRAAAMNELRRLGFLIEAHYTDTGKMPTRAEVLAAVEKDAPEVLPALKDGSFVLTDTTEHGTASAYEVDADKAGGLVLVGTSVLRASAEEARTHLAAVKK